MIKSFKRYLAEAGGQAAGQLEIAKTKLRDARVYAERLFARNGRDLDEQLPNFDSHYEQAKRAARQGWTQRRDMPVITDDDVKQLQARLKQGMIDIEAPYAPSTEPGDPFPEGLSREEADQFLERGLKDSDLSDDKVKLSKKRVTVSKLKPIQQQIYFDKSIAGIAENGVDGSRKFMTQISTFICSSDLYIIDGHHRYLGSMLLDPSMKVQCLVIDLPINKLLPLSLAYGDAIGNQRNA